jgi:hypothetical protein
MKKYITIFSIMIVIFGCKSKLKPRELGAYDYKTSCVSNSNGTMIVTAWGQGKNKEICKTVALKRAITDVVFKGIIDGSPSCTQPPVVTVVNAESKYQEFMTSFLSESGKYKSYASIYDEPISQSHSKKIRKLDDVENMALEFQIQIDRNGLVKLFKQENLLKN